MAGTKELTEAVVGLNELTLALVPLLKDGVQLGDAVALWAKLQADAGLKDKLVAAAQGLQAVPAEASELDASEIVALVVLQAGYVPKLVEAFKAAAPAPEAPEAA